MEPLYQDHQKLVSNASRSGLLRPAGFGNSVLGKKTKTEKLNTEHVQFNYAQILVGQEGAEKADHMRETFVLPRGRLTEEEWSRRG